MAPRSRRVRALLDASMIILLVLVSLGCRRSAGGGQAVTTIRVSGAWGLYPMMIRWVEEYRRLNPSVRIEVSAGGAGKGAADALSGLVELGMVSRAIKPEEGRLGAVYVPVVKDAIFPVVSAANPFLDQLRARGLRRKMLADLFVKGFELRWGAFFGRSDDRRMIHTYTRSDSCGAAETWAHYLGARSQEQLKGVGVYGDPGLAEAVRRDPLGIGYMALGYAYHPRSGQPVAGLVMAAIDIDENGRVDPGEDLSTKARATEAVTSGRYPSPPARALYLITKGAFKGATRDFVRFILGDGQRFVDEVGYIQLSPSALSEARKKLEGN